MNLFLKLLILRKFGSQANFAQAVGADETLVSRIIHGRRILPEEKRRQWAEVLGVDPEGFASGGWRFEIGACHNSDVKGGEGNNPHAHSANVQTEKKTN